MKINLYQGSQLFLLHPIWASDDITNCSGAVFFFLMHFLVSNRLWNFKLAGSKVQRSYHQNECALKRQVLY